jgi:hypothetical protein
MSEMSEIYENKIESSQDISNQRTLCIEGVEIPEQLFIEVPEIADYIYEMSPIQKKALKIAILHLNTSFDFSRSNGFVEWISTRSSKS